MIIFINSLTNRKGLNRFTITYLIHLPLTLICTYITRPTGVCIATWAFNAFTCNLERVFWQVFAANSQGYRRIAADLMRRVCTKRHQVKLHNCSNEESNCREHRREWVIVHWGEKSTPIAHWSVRTTLYLGILVWKEYYWSGFFKKKSIRSN